MLSVSALHYSHVPVCFDLLCGPVCMYFRCEQTNCDGLLRPAVVWFGETLDSDILTRAEKVLDRCDLCLVVCVCVHANICSYAC